MSKCSLKKGPNIQAHFSVNGDRIVRICLQESFSFNWEVIGAGRDLEKKISEWMEQYSSGCEPSIILPLLMPDFPPFTLKILQMLRAIPFGISRTYGNLDHPKNARAVGNACGRNPFPLVVPCHRILGARGIGGFSQGLSIKEKILKHENLA